MQKLNVQPPKKILAVLPSLETGSQVLRCVPRDVNRCVPLQVPRHDRVTGTLG
jgi:hypothetical protein